MERMYVVVACKSGKRNYKGISTGNIGIRQWQLPGPPRASFPARPPSPNLHAWSSSHARTLNPHRRSWLCTACETLGELALSMCSLQPLRIDMPGHLPWQRVLTYQSIHYSTSWCCSPSAKNLRNWMRIIFLWCWATLAKVNSTHQEHYQLHKHKAPIQLLSSFHHKKYIKKN